MTWLPGHVPKTNWCEDGREENAINQFAFQNKREIAERRAELYALLKQMCDGRIGSRVKVLEMIIQEAEERCQYLVDAAEGIDLRFVEGQAVWFNYHRAWCRYWELQANVIAALLCGAGSG
jgi:hypothetical protein